ncbi:MAG: TatD family hydrolase [Parcubacteria group bacterium]|nr:TatD family hydrolase [Parcubacteria group bacterium]
MRRSCRVRGNLINVGVTPKTSEEVVAFAETHENCYAAVGIHPTDIFLYKEEPQFDLIEKLCSQGKKIIAIGEIGLDYSYFKTKEELSEKREQQMEFLHIMLEIAEQYSLPIIFHCRGSAIDNFNAYDDLYDFLKKKMPSKGGVIHCWSADSARAKKFLSLGFYLGFTGIITFKNAKDFIVDSVRYAPNDRLLIETDCPFLTPEPFRGQRNEPAYVRFVAEKIAEIKKISFEEIEKATTENAKKLFGI